MIIHHIDYLYFKLDGKDRILVLNRHLNYTLNSINQLNILTVADERRVKEKVEIHQGLR